MILPSTPPEISRRLRELDSRLRLRFDPRQRCWVVDEHVGAWNKWSPVLYWRDSTTKEPFPIEGACDAIISKLRDADWSRYGQRAGARDSDIANDIEEGSLIKKADPDEDRYRFNHHARDLYLRQMGHRKTFGAGPVTRLDSKEKAGYLHKMMAAKQRASGVWVPK